MNIKKTASVPGNFGSSLLGGRSVTQRQPSPGGRPASKQPAGAREKYPQATTQIAMMQRHLVNLGSRIQMQALSKKDQNSTEKTRLAAQISGTQRGRDLHSTDDGIWGVNTENALKALQIYIQKYHKDITDSLNVARIPENLMSQERIVIERIKKNVVIIGKVLAAEGDVSLLSGNLSGSQLLDQIPDDYNQALTPLNFGNIIIKAANLGRLFDAKQILNNVIPHVNKNDDNIQVLQSSTAGSEFKINSITKDDISAYFDSTGNFISSISMLYGIEKGRVLNNISYFLNTIKSKFPNIPGSPRNQNVGYIVQWFDQKINEGKQPLNKESVESFYKNLQEQIYRFLFQGENKIILSPTRESRSTREYSEFLTNEFNKMALSWSSNKADKISNKQFLYEDVVSSFFNKIKGNPQDIYTDPDLRSAIPFLQQKQNERTGSEEGWTYGQYELMVNLLLQRSTGQLAVAKSKKASEVNEFIHKNSQLGVGDVFSAVKSVFNTQRESENLSKKDVPIKELYVMLSQKLKRELEMFKSEIIKRFREKFNTSSIDLSLLPGMVIPDSLLSTRGGQLNSKDPVIEQLQGEGGIGGGSRQRGGGGGGTGGSGQTGGAGGQAGQSGFGSSDLSQAAPNVAVPPIGRSINLNYLAKWTEPGLADSLPHEALSLIQLGNVSNNPGRQRLVTALGGPVQARTYLSVLSQMINSGVTNWAQVLNRFVNAGKITQSDADIRLRQVEPLRVSWLSNIQNTLTGMTRR